MGADLYIESIFDANCEQYQNLFHEWAEKRDAYHRQGQIQQAEAAQAKVDEYYTKMYERGYFRDSYNPSNLLWLFELSWWEDVGNGMLNEERYMSAEHAECLLEMLAERESIFETNLAQQLAEEPAEQRADVETYFRTKYEKLKSFLKEAIALDEPILCSI